MSLNGRSSKFPGETVFFTFSSDTNFVTDFGVDPTLYKACHHNPIFAKISFNISLPRPFYWDI